MRGELLGGVAEEADLVDGVMLLAQLLHDLYMRTPTLPGHHGNAPTLPHTTDCRRRLSRSPIF